MEVMGETETPGNRDCRGQQEERGKQEDMIWSRGKAISHSGHLTVTVHISVYLSFDLQPFYEMTLCDNWQRSCDYYCAVSFSYNFCVTSSAFKCLRKCSILSQM